MVDAKKQPKAKAGKPNDLLLSENSESTSADGFGITVGGGTGKKGKGNSMDTNA